MEALTTQRDDIRLRKVDVVSWDSEVARQHGIRRLPTVWLYQDGKRVAGDTRGSLARLEQVLRD